MPKLAFNFENEIRRSIRDIYAIDPLITGQKLLQALNKRYNRSFDYRYIEKLKRKVIIEATPNLDKEKVEDRLRQTRELVRIGKEDLMKIAYGQQSPDGSYPSRLERLAAWRTISMLEKLQLEAESQLHIFDKPIDPSFIDAFRWRPIPEDVRTPLMNTLRLWSMPTDMRRVLAPGSVQEAEVKELPTPAPVEAPAAKQTAKTPIIPSHGITPDPELRLH